MTVALKNFIGGEWVDGSGITSEHQPLQHQRCRRRIRQGRQSADRKGDRCGEGRVPRLVAFDAAGAL